jgi:prepilin-type N-terminal cleavage/methylation domain-containing protein
MNSRPHRSSRAFAFTLVELLVVIAIIAILMSLLFPAIGMVKDAARKAEAKAAVTGIVAAVKAYNTEYGKYPYVGNVAADKDATVGEGYQLTNATLFNVLRAKAVGDNLDNKYNPRKISFFEGKAAGDQTAPKSGFVEGSGANAGMFYDPWGNQYCVIIDTNYDNQIDMGSQGYQDFAFSTGASNKAPQTGVGAYSLGKDGKIGNNGDGNYKKGGTASDDVVSWQ